MQSIKMFIYIIEGIIPGEVLNEAVISIVKEVQSKSVGTITISAIITLWSAGRGFFALCKGLSNSYKVETENEYIKVIDSIEDIEKSMLEEVQKLTNEYTKKVDDKLKEKETELLSI